jgi:DNA gyrase/topoisomerase IV subunit A
MNAMPENELARRRIELLKAYLAAFDRREDVVRAVAHAANAHDAARDVATLLQITPSSAEAVLDLRLARLARDGIEVIREELKTLIIRHQREH